MSEGFKDQVAPPINYDELASNRLRQLNTDIVERFQQTNQVTETDIVRFALLSNQVELDTLHHMENGSQPVQDPYSINKRVELADWRLEELPRLLKFNPEGKIEGYVTTDGQKPLSAGEAAMLIDAHSTARAGLKEIPAEYFTSQARRIYQEHYLPARRKELEERGQLPEKRRLASGHIDERFPEIINLDNRENNTRQIRVNLSSEQIQFLTEIQNDPDMVWYFNERPYLLLNLSGNVDTNWVGRHQRELARFGSGVTLGRSGVILEANSRQQYSETGIMYQLEFVDGKPVFNLVLANDRYSHGFDEMLKDAFDQAREFETFSPALVKNEFIKSMPPYRKNELPPVLWI